jgi:hypothetical protein
MEDNDLMEQLMGEQRYLVILEEVTTMVEWDVIKMYLPESNNGSRIVVSTKQLQTALFCTGKPYQVSELTRLTNNQSLCAFSNKVSHKPHKLCPCKSINMYARITVGLVQIAGLLNLYLLYYPNNLVILVYHFKKCTPYILLPHSKVN